MDERRKPRSSEEVQEITVTPVQESEVQMRARLLAMFRDLRHNYVDMPEDWLKKEDYPMAGDPPEKTVEFERRSKNKRRIAWSTSTMQGAELAAEHFVRDPMHKEQIFRFIAMLKPTVESGKPVTDEQVSDGDTILDMVIAALETEQERDDVRGAA